MNTEPKTPYVPKIRRKVGLGDVVAAVANPIARGIDQATSALPPQLRTHLKGCGGCAQRKSALNEILPNVNPLG